MAFKVGKLLAIPKPNTEDLLSHKSQCSLTLLSTLGKGLERIILDCLEHHRTDWFDPAQLGFLKGCSTETQLLSFLSHIESTLQRDKRVAAISFDISGAFDHAWHPSIIINLYNLGCPPSYLLLIADFLSNRHIV